MYSIGTAKQHQWEVPGSGEGVQRLPEVQKAPGVHQSEPRVARAEGASAPGQNSVGGVGGAKGCQSSAPERTRAKQYWWELPMSLGCRGTEQSRQCRAERQWVGVRRGEAVPHNRINPETKRASSSACPAM